MDSRNLFEQYSDRRDGCRVTVYAGPARSGKSETMYDEIVDLAYREPNRNIFLIVPEQSSSHLEQKLVQRMRKRHGQMGFFNLDILGFSRLSYRIIDALNIKTEDVLGEYGKSMLLRTAAGLVKSELKYYKNSIDKKGFIDKVKTVLSELTQYNITESDLAKARERMEEERDRVNAGVTGDKLDDFIRIMHAASQNPVLKEHYTLPEQLIEQIGVLLESCHREGREIPLIENASFYFDNFRGFTPMQLVVLEKLALFAKDMNFTLCVDRDTLEREITTGNVEPYELFFNSIDTYRDLRKAFPNLSIRYFQRAVWNAEAGAAAQETGSRETVFSDNMLRHLEKNLFRFPVEISTKEEDGTLEIWKCKSPEKELENVARDIRRKIRASGGALRYRDFAVISSDLSSLNNYIHDIFRDYEIPYFLDYERSFGNNPYTTVFLGLLRIVVKDFEYEAVFSCLKTGVFPYEMEDIERLENYVLRRGIRGKRLWSKPISPLIKRVDGQIVESEELLLAEEVRSDFMERMKPLLRLGNRKVQGEDLIAAISKVIGEAGLDFEQQIWDSSNELFERERYADAKAYRGLYPYFTMLLEKFTDILGEMELSMDEGLEILESGVEEIGIGVIPPVLDNVVVGDFERSKVDDVLYLYIIDANEGILPRVIKNSNLITDYDRKKILAAFSSCGIEKKMAPGEEQNTYYEQFYIYQMMAKPRVKLTVAYCIAGRDGSQLEPSYVLGRIHKLFPRLKEKEYLKEPDETDFLGGTQTRDRFLMAEVLRTAVESEQDRESAIRKAGDLAAFFPVENFEQALTYCNKAEQLEKSLIDQMNLKISISKVQRYAACPYQFFLQYILGLTQRKEHTAGADEIGNVVHRALELIFEEMKEKHGNQWKSVDEAVLSGIVNEKIEQAIQEEGEALRLQPDNEDGKLKFVRDNVERLTERTVEILKYQLSDGEMLPEFIETGFSAKFVTKKMDGSDYPVTIVGKIDRGDVFEEDDRYYLRVLDYKTGNKSLNLEGLIEGSDIQLTVYLDILVKLLNQQMRDKKVIPAGMYFYHVADEVIKKFESEGETSEAELVKKAEEEYKKALRIRGIPNYDPYQAASDQKNQDDQENRDDQAVENEEKQYRSLEIQEASVLDEKRELLTGKILPIDLGGRQTVSYTTKKLKADTFLINTKDYEVIREYSGWKLCELTRKILSGDIEKIRTMQVSTGKTDCRFCAYKPVCRFSEGSGKERVKEEARKNSDLLERIRRELEEKKKDPTLEGAEYSELRFLPKKEKNSILSAEEEEARFEEIANHYEDDFDTDEEESSED